MPYYSLLLRIKIQTCCTHSHFLRAIWMEWGKDDLLLGFKKNR